MINDADDSTFECSKEWLKVDLVTPFPMHAPIKPYKIMSQAEKRRGIADHDPLVL